MPSEDEESGVECPNCETFLVYSIGTTDHYDEERGHSTREEFYLRCPDCGFTKAYEDYRGGEDDD